MSLSGKKGRIYVWTCLVLVGVYMLYWTLAQDPNPDVPILIQSSSDVDGNVDKSPPENIQIPVAREHIHIETLDTALLPESSRSGSKHHKNRRRLIFIGDIHGCIDELQQLLDRANYNHKHDHIIALGDMVNKGPDSKAVLDLLRDRKASCVRGNHDDTILREVDALRSQDVEDLGWVEDPEHKLARSLTRHQIEYLRSCPIILRVGELKTGYFVAVHGGLVPSLQLDEQNVFDVMNMRIIDRNTHEPSKDHYLPGFVPWAELWNDFQASLADNTHIYHGRRPPNSQPITVVYGHDAKSGLQIRRYTRGLDSGCVGGGRLSALIVDNKGEQDVVQVDCRSYID